MVVTSGAPDSARIYDQGVKNWLTTNIKLNYVTPVMIPNVFASPEKVYAEMDRLQSIGKKLRPKLPFISITRVLSIKDVDKYNRADIRSLDWADPEKKSSYTTSYPVPVNISYQFDVWMNFADDKNRIEEMFQLLFNHPVYLSFYIDDKVKTKACYFTLDSVSDTSVLEPIMQANRVFRNTYNCTLQAMFYYGYSEVKMIGTPEMVALGVSYYDVEVYSAKEQSANMVVIDPNDWNLEAILTGG